MDLAIVLTGGCVGAILISVVAKLAYKAHKATQSKMELSKLR